MRRVFAVLAIGGALALAPAAAQAAPRRLPARSSSPPPVPAGTTRPRSPATACSACACRPPGRATPPARCPAQSELAGFYAQISGSPKASDNVQQRANIPTWSTLTFSENGQTFAVPGPGISNWRQSLDLHTGIVTTAARWTAPDGHVTDLSYQVLTDRAGAVRGPGPPAAHAALDRARPRSPTRSTARPTRPRNPELTSQVSKGWDAGSQQDWVTIKALGTNIEATLASQLQVSPNVAGHDHPDRSDDRPERRPDARVPGTPPGRRTRSPSTSGSRARRTRPDTVTAARGQATSAATTGWDALLGANKAAWAAMWRGWIEILGNRTLATDVNASEFYLWSSTRAGVDWSVSPAGLSSNGYDGHIFWDAETWMYPSLLAQHPDLAAGMNDYRFDRLTTAEQHATAHRLRRARASRGRRALDGTEQIPPPVSVNSEGLYEQHITADIALAQWQYYLATGDKTWLAQQGWPVLSQAAATFWASRATRGSDGKYHFDGVTGPDEENPNVNDEAYTNVGAMRTLQDAVAAARRIGSSPRRRVGRRSPRTWSCRSGRRSIRSSPATATSWSSRPM